MSNGTNSPRLLWKRNPDLDSTMTFEDDPFASYKPPEWDQKYRLVWYIDPICNPLPDPVWVMSCEVVGKELEGDKNMGYLLPELNIEFNPDLPDLSINVNDCCPAFYDMAHECAWELDPMHTDSPMWAVKFTPKYRTPKEWKWYGTVSPTYQVEYNPDLPKMKTDLDYVIPWHDLTYEHVWYLEGNEKIWVAKLKVVNDPVGTKDMGTVELDSPELDVVFISYHEPNAEANWQRVLEKAPYAKRVDGVEGIFEAHKAAARLSNTDMFYVVDGDAYLVDEWHFNFEPNIFDRDCSYVWNSLNPVNDLIYGYGGVKLFPRSLLLKKRKWETLDMFTGISNKLKVMDTVSNLTQFNTDEFSTWRSAFREVVKICNTIKDNPDDVDALNRLTSWETIGIGKPFGSYAIQGAKSAKEFFDNADKQSLNQINDRKWLMSVFDHIKKKVIPIEPVEKRNTLCAIPWMHLAFEPNGKVVPCCLTSTHDYFAGDLTTQTIDEIWNSNNMKQLRKEMINGVEPKICDKCFNREKVTGESGRYYHNKNFPDVLAKVPSITLEDGTCTEMNLKYWDFRFSNLCNFKCRSCGPRYSSAWVPDSMKLGHSIQDKVWSINSVDNQTNYTFLADQIDNVKSIYFAGGEPLLMPEHWQILDMLLENKRFDVRLNYNTNCSKLEYGKKNIIDYWSQWHLGKLEVWPSIDEIGPRAELIRSGTVWHEVETNLKKLASMDNIILRPGLTIGAWNVNRLPEIVEHLVSIGVIRKHPKSTIINYNNFFINLLEEPSHYHVHILPEEFRKETIKKLEDFIIEHNKKYNTSIDAIFTHILHELKKPFNLQAAKRFIKTTKQLDTIREENTYEVIPEMIHVVDAVNRAGE